MVIARGVTCGTAAGGSFQVSGRTGAQHRHSPALTPLLLKSRGTSSPPHRGKEFGKPPFRTAFLLHYAFPSLRVPKACYKEHAYYAEPAPLVLG